MLPGVGAVGDALRQVRSAGLDRAIVDHCAAGKPFLGICLGLQMLFDTCHEGGRHNGLGILPGEVVRFDVDRADGPEGPAHGLEHARHGERHARSPPASTTARASTSSTATTRSAPNPADVATTTDYGRPFVSSVRRGNVMAVQFHPEKSQKRRPADARQLRGAAGGVGHRLTRISEDWHRSEEEFASPVSPSVPISSRTLKPAPIHWKNLCQSSEICANPWPTPTPPTPAVSPSAS